MDSLIRETNENLNAIIASMKSNLDNYISTLDNIQMQMDKKVEEAKKYKIQVDNAKEKIKEYEESNKSLELSLKELNDKYGKMNLVSLVEAGNREIKNKINDNNRGINKEKEHIADLTNKARTIKDLLINLKKDKTIKEERLENIKVVYEYYSERINDIVDYAFNHSENLRDYKISYNMNEKIINVDDDTINNELENTMVFDEIANIDDSKIFKDEMSFIEDQINKMNDDKFGELINQENSERNIDEQEIEDVEVNEDIIDSTQVFDSILINDIIENEQENDLAINDESKMLDNSIEANNSNIQDLNLIVNDVNDDNIKNEFTSEHINVEENLELENPLNDKLIEFSGIKEEENLDNETNIKVDEIQDIAILNKDENSEQNLDIYNIEGLKNNNEDNILENEERINQINDLFTSIDNTKTSNFNLNISENNINGTFNKIDNAYMDIFGKTLEEEDLNKEESTLTDIFGNPIKKEELSEEIKTAKKIEELFVENGIDFNKFKEDEKNYLKQIYNEEKFNNILSTLKRNKINFDNIYNSFNIFGEISANELESIISKLIVSGQSVEAIGLVLEKLPKVKKYNLSEAIISYGDYIKDIDITDLIMKAKELYNGGNN